LHLHDLPAGRIEARLEERDLLLLVPAPRRLDVRPEGGAVELEQELTVRSRGGAHGPFRGGHG
jgi:hypothetical protein